MVTDTSEAVTISDAGTVVAANCFTLYTRVPLFKWYDFGIHSESHDTFTTLVGRDTSGELQPRRAIAILTKRQDAALFVIDDLILSEWVFDSRRGSELIAAIRV